jgi:hypothetical protein
MKMVSPGTLTVESRQSFNRQPLIGGFASTGREDEIEIHLNEGKISAVTLPWPGKAATVPKSEITIEKHEKGCRITVPARLLQLRSEQRNQK